MTGTRFPATSEGGYTNEVSEVDVHGAAEFRTLCVPGVRVHGALSRMGAPARWARSQPSVAGRAEALTRQLRPPQRRKKEHCHEEQDYYLCYLPMPAVRRDRRARPIWLRNHGVRSLGLRRGDR